MEPSLAGVLVSCGLFLLGLALGSPLIVALFAALPFGSTAIAAVGGSSPLVFTVFAIPLLASIALSRGFLDDLAAVFTNIRAAPIVCGLTAYAIASAILFPRLFAGETSAHVVIGGQVVEVPLGPIPGNFTQTAYFILGALIFLGFCILLQQRDRWQTIERGFFTFATVHAALGLIDVGAKLAGFGDVLAPIRSAGYALLVEVMEPGGFWRIVGAYPEASTFGAYTLPCLAFTFTHWRRAGSRYALALSFVLLLLLVFSTSTTAYAGLAIVVVLFSVSTGLTALRGRFRVNDLLFFALLWVSLAIALCAYLYNESIFDPFVAMLDTMVFDKAASGSGQERAYWNAKGVEAFFATYGLGIGMGSSRSSSWVISVLSQLGIVGAVLFAFLIAELLRRVGGVTPSPANQRVIALGESARAATIAWLIALTISAGSADPGLIFFIGLATVVSCRERVSQATASPARLYRRAH